MDNVASSVKTSPAPRLVSLDAFRGMVMFLMLAEVLSLAELATHILSADPTDRPSGVAAAAWEWLRFHTTHVPWIGCSLHDLIQPGFSFLVGAALPFSLQKRTEQGQGAMQQYVHAAWRSLLLIGLGVFVRSLKFESTYFTFEDTLTQIGLGYFLLFLIARGPVWLPWPSVLAILFAYWGWFAMFPPAADFDYSAVGVPSDWPYHAEGLASAWNKNSHVAWSFDTWFLNLFPREEPFLFHRGGYSTLNFIPTLATMIMGLILGRWLGGNLSLSQRMVFLFGSAAACLLVGWGLDAAGICPIVKRIWTPSFALWSGGWCFLIAGSLHLWCDVLGFRRWAFPLVVIGCNCIFIYLVNWTLKSSIIQALHRHLGTTTFEWCGPEFANLWTGICVLSIYWLVLFWMYQRRLFIKI